MIWLWLSSVSTGFGFICDLMLDFCILKCPFLLHCFEWYMYLHDFTKVFSSASVSGFLTPQKLLQITDSSRCFLGQIPKLRPDDRALPGGWQLVDLPAGGKASGSGKALGDKGGWAQTSRGDVRCWRSSGCFCKAFRLPKNTEIDRE